MEQRSWKFFQIKLFYLCKKRERQSSWQTHNRRTGTEVRKAHTHTGRSGERDARTHAPTRKQDAFNKPDESRRTLTLSRTAGHGKEGASFSLPSSSHFTLPARAQKREGRRPCSGPPPAGAPPSPSASPFPIFNIFNRRQPLLQVLRKIALMKS